MCTSPVSSLSKPFWNIVLGLIPTVPAHPALPCYMGAAGTWRKARGSRSGKAGCFRNRRTYTPAMTSSPSRAGCCSRHPSGSPQSGRPAACADGRGKAGLQQRTSTSSHLGQIFHVVRGHVGRLAACAAAAHPGGSCSAERRVGQLQALRLSHKRHATTGASPNAGLLYSVGCSEGLAAHTAVAHLSPLTHLLGVSTPRIQVLAMPRLL